MGFFESPFFTSFPHVLASAPNHPLEPDASSYSDDDSAETSNDSDAMAESGSWNLGGLVKTIALKSEGMFESYRKDLQEFGSGLRNETKFIAEVAALAVMDLPASLETGAARAQESIESVGQVIEDISSSVWRGTADIVAQGKHAVLNESSGSIALIPLSKYRGELLSDGKYSHFEALVRSMQQDSRTYCNEPEDEASDYTAWKSTFVLWNKREEIELLIADNTLMKEIFTRLVPDMVSEETFWTRYFYRFHKLRQNEDARESLVKRACAGEEEELSWETEESGGEEEGMSQEEIKPETSKLEARENAAEAQSVVKHASNSRPVANPSVAEDEDFIGWDDSECDEDYYSKRSSNSEGSWEVPEIPRQGVISRKNSVQSEENEDLCWDIDDDDTTK